MRSSSTSRPLLSTWVLLLIALASSTPTTRYVSFTGTTWQQQLAGYTCAGLFNREASATSAYIYNSGDVWLKLTENVTSPPLTKPEDFLSECLQGPAAHRYIRYNSSSQQALIPNIITLAAVLDAVPLESTVPQSTALAFDAVSMWPPGTTPHDATRYVYEHHVNATTGMSKLNPGYESQSGKAILHPKLTGSPSLALVDYIVKARLFNLYLTDGCIPLTQEHSLFKQIVTTNPWPRPIAVMGYDNTVVIEGGDTFEAETLCVGSVGLGQIASQGFLNGGYFSRKPALTTPLPHNKDVTTAYNASKTYIAFLVGDGDNIDFLQGSRRQWIQSRVAKCKGEACSFPLLWTMNPHIMKLAPAWAQWYADQLLITKTDRFALPPSGDSYAYPSMFPEKDQEAFVARTERDCTLLSTSMTTAWEFAAHWVHALKDYFPKYGPHGIVQSLVGVNVPYMLPTLAFGKDMYKVVGSSSQSANASVVFKPHEWRGTRGSKIPFANQENLNVSMMAAQINGYTPGTVSPIYITSDGGANLDIIYELVAALDEHVAVAGLEIGQYAMEHARRKALEEAPK